MSNLLRSTELLECEPGKPATADVIESVDRWISSPAMRQLITICGWSWPSGSLSERLDGLVRLSRPWDFRSGAERHDLSERPAVVDGRTLDEQDVHDAVAALGLITDPASTPSGQITHILVLGGMARACFNRSRLAERHRIGEPLPGVTLLTAQRPLAPAELAYAQERGWEDVQLESDAAVHAAREVFQLAEVPDERSGGQNDDGIGGADSEVEPGELTRRRSWCSVRWTRQANPVEVLAVASRKPLVRRANTADQLEDWATRAGTDRRGRVLVVTTEHYVPFQHFDAVRILGVGHGWGVQTLGTQWEPAGGFRAAGFLQEVRSALFAAQRLLRSVATSR